MKDALFLIFCCSLSTVSCADIKENHVKAPSACASDAEARESVLKNIEILVTLDQHGGFAALKMCPDHAFSIDFSRSDLFTKKYSAVLDQMQLGSMAGTTVSTEMIVSGFLRKKRSGESRDTLLVEKIISYRLH